ncbi:DUF6538 domain-containing protein [Phyllobacterium bourgognense]|uniref:DUF6538 domain-containing protein n=1 Tax=Phyllobacterium bourgognense TaxID=314236 RepID=UPI00315DDDEB
MYERRRATYYARLDVPLDLVDHYGTRTRKKSLRTTSPLLVAWYERLSWLIRM